MSRYTIDSTKPGIEIVVGWDPPLRSLFAQVSDRKITADDEADPMLLWEDFVSIDALSSAIAPWATLPDDIRQTLAVESGEKPARRPPDWFLIRESDRAMANISRSVDIAIRLTSTAVQ